MMEFVTSSTFLHAMITTRLNRPLFQLAVPLISCIVISLCQGILHGQAAPRNPTEQEVRELFERLTQPVPRRLRIEAELEILMPAWTEAQVQRELANQERIMEPSDRHLVPDQRAVLRQARLQAIRNSNSGRRGMKVREWLSGALYRLDQTDSSSLEADATLASKITNGVISYHMTFVNIGDPAFTNMTAFSSNHSLESATIGTAKHARLELWQALTIEPNLAMPFLILLVDTNSVAAAAVNHVDTSFAGWRPDARKLDAMVRQEIPHWSFSVRERVMEGRPVNCFLMEGLPGGPTQGFQLAFYSEIANPNRLWRIEAKSEKSPTRYTSIRERFDAIEFPRYWRTESVDEKGARTTRTVTFTEANLNPIFDEDEVFLPRFPTNFIVAAITPSGDRHIVQHPNPQARIIDRSASPRRKPTLIVVIALLLLTPFLLLRRKAT
jgi:hypothetical protein